MEFYLAGLSFFEFKRYCEEHDGMVFKTESQGKEFVFNVTESGFQYKPLSTDKPRKQKFEVVEKLIDAVKKKGSLSTGDYSEETRNASYFLALIRAYFLEPLSDEEVNEGTQKDAKILKTKRDKKLVKERKETDGYTCQACSSSIIVNGRYILDCHHLKPLADFGEVYTTLEDLVTLCPTCHRIAHTRRLPLSLEEIKEELFKSST